MDDQRCALCGKETDEHFLTVDATGTVVAGSYGDDGNTIHLCMPEVLAVELSLRAKDTEFRA